ncbi:hypothetical protein SAMN04488118_112100 [Epibacterium ulvae]|uniref:Uncharacterized protein n=1 Tax=Epibacterium ulvae TaxID=1156985 RepID=A0A1G5RCE3_9RHOB|nr:hypothetical protein [Epibacterium ulvae]SCZ71717.1 hypothetical protein SAMN04488118_112100 [Epibacterium ulvae]
MLRKTLLATLVFAASMSVAAADEIRRIHSEARMIDLVAAHTYKDAKGNWVRINANGTMVGQYGGKPLNANWVWSGAYWCRNGHLGGVAIGSDCQEFYASRTQFHTIRNKGKGDWSSLMTRQ